jgi:pimeloyl-ACP methyl ester carboxylesterase
MPSPDRPRYDPVAGDTGDAGMALLGWVVRAVGVLLLFTALAMAWLREPDRSAQSLVARWAPPPSSFVVVRGQVVHLRDEGPRDDPLPIVLLHGTSSSLHTWDDWAKGLKGQRRVLRLDLPGFGLTGPFTGEGGGYAPGRYSAAIDAAFTLDVLDRLGVTRAVVVGHSLGGEVAWRLAVQAPQRVAALVLVDAIGPPFAPGDVPLGWQLARAPVLNRLLDWVLPRELVAQGLATVWGDPDAVTPALVDRHFELTLREGNRRALVQRLQQLQLGADAERIAEVAAPTLLLWGGTDRLVPPSVGEDFARRIAGSRLVVLDGLGHVPHEEDPARTLAEVQRFLGSLQPAAGTMPAPESATAVAR